MDGIPWFLTPSLKGLFTEWLPLSEAIFSTTKKKKNQHYFMYLVNILHVDFEPPPWNMLYVMYLVKSKGIKSFFFFKQLPNFISSLDYHASGAKKKNPLKILPGHGCRYFYIITIKRKIHGDMKFIFDNDFTNTQILFWLMSRLCSYGKCAWVLPSPTESFMGGYRGCGGQNKAPSPQKIFMS